MVELTTNLLVDLGGWAAMKEARGLVQRGAVIEARREGAVILGKVRGAEKVHEPRIVLAERVAGVEVRCTCAESRRHGRVCAHALAIGLAVLEGKAPLSSPAAAGEGGRSSGEARPRADEGHRAPLPRMLLDDAPGETTRLELAVLLPLQLSEVLAKDPVRVILEARRGDEAQALPFDAVTGGGPFAVNEEDERVLAALESLAGGAAGINAVPRGRIGALLHALGGHPRVWLGKKERIEVRAAEERARIAVGRREDGALVLEAKQDQRETEFRGEQGRSQAPAEGGKLGNEGFATGASGKRTAPQPPPGARRLPLVLPNWTFDGATLTESPALPAGFTSGTRIVPLEKIPEFLSREWPALERACDLQFASGFEEFRLEVGRPSFEVRLDGALSGLTLELVAHYESASFPLNGKEESTVYQRYFPASRVRRSEEMDGITEGRNGEESEQNLSQKNSVHSVIPSPLQPAPSVFWRRDVLAERRALGEVETAGFARVRGGAAAFSLVSENKVARFLANTLPRWRRDWKVTTGARLQATLAEVDIAEPEFSLRGDAGNDWLGLDLKLSVGGRPVPLDAAEVQRWLQTGQSHARTTKGRVLLVPTEAWGEMQEVLADCEVEQEPGAMRVGRTFAPYLSGALTAQGFRDAGAARASAAAVDVEAGLPAELWAQLRPYQAQGVEWLARLARENLHGLLADEMGLGKTLQALAFCAWLKAEGSRGGCGDRGGGKADQRETEFREEQARSRASAEGSQLGNEGSNRKGNPALIVCPTSLVTNWLREAGRFTPWLRALDLTGADRAEKWARVGEGDLLVTSYAILRRDIERYRGMDFSLVVLDEAQHIKNRASQNAAAAKALRARHRLVLTGTPLENSVLDLWSLFDFLVPGYLGTAAEFKERYEGPLTRAPEPKLMERLRHRVRPFFLRRTKTEVLTDLPAKLDFPALVELSDEQRAAYRAVLEQGRREVFAHSDKAGRKSGRDRLAVLTTLLRLRQVCCHLDLLPGGEGRSEKVEGRSGEAAEAVSVLPPSSFSLLPSRWREPSAKMERTFELIDEAIDGGHRVLLFSQFVRMLHLLREEARRREIPFCYLDGQTVERQAEVDRFQADETIPLFFISLKAGGTGLNLTGADTVIHFDPWWNPAVEEQATARAHRIGQSRDVSAYKLIAAGTVEEKIQQLQARKRELFEASLGGDEALVEKLTGDEIEELLTE